MRKRVSRLYEKVLNYNNSFVLSIFVYSIYVAVSIIFLSYNNFFPILESQEFANLAIALKDSIFKSLNYSDINLAMQGGSSILLAPLTALFFFLFNESFYSTELLLSFLAGLWALVYFLTACHFLEEKRLILAIIFSIATPLMFINGAVGFVFYTHFGVSLVFGVSLLFILKSIKETNNTKKALFLLLSGGFYLISFFWGHMSLLLSPFIVLLFFRSELKLSAFKFWLIGFFISFLFCYQYIGWGYLYYLLTTGDIYSEERTAISVFFEAIIFFGGVST